MWKLNSSMYEQQMRYQKRNKNIETIGNGNTAYQADNSEKVYKINACLKKKRKIANKQINFIPQRTRKRTNLAQVQKKEIPKIRAEINEIKIKKQQKRSMKLRHFIF